QFTCNMLGEKTARIRICRRNCRCGLHAPKSRVKLPELVRIFAPLFSYRFSLLQGRRTKDLDGYTRKDVVESRRAVRMSVDMGFPHGQQIFDGRSIGQIVLAEKSEFRGDCRVEVL